MKEFFLRIQFPLAIIFALVGVVTVVDFCLPSTVTKCNLYVFVSDDNDRKPEEINPDATYYAETSTGSFAIDPESMLHFKKGDELLQTRSQILRATTSFSLVTEPEERFSVLTGPFRAFPMIPLLLFLPLVFVRFVPSESMFGIAGTNASFILAVAALSLCLIG